MIFDSGVINKKTVLRVKSRSKERESVFTSELRHSIAADGCCFCLLRQSSCLFLRTFNRISISRTQTL